MRQRRILCRAWHARATRANVSRRVVHDTVFLHTLLIYVCAGNTCMKDTFMGNDSP